MEYDIAWMDALETERKKREKLGDELFKKLLNLAG